MSRLGIMSARTERGMHPCLEGRGRGRRLPSTTVGTSVVGRCSIRENKLRTRQIRDGGL